MKSSSTLSPDAVISELVHSGFSAHATTSAQKNLAGVVQSEIADRLDASRLR